MPSVVIPLIIGSHIHPGESWDPSSKQADNAVARVSDMLGKMKLDRRPLIIPGRNSAPAKGAKAEATAAVRQIIAEAMQQNAGLPLYYVAGGGLTDLAEAYRLEPRIGQRA